MNEVIRGEYVAQEDGTYQLDVAQNEAGYGLGNIKNLHSTANSERQARKALESKYKPFDGLDANQVHEAISFRTDYEEKNINHQEETQKKIASVQAQLSKQFDEKETAWGTTRDALVNKLQRSEIDNFIKSQLTSIVADPSDIDLLLPHFRNRMTLDEEYNAIVLDTYGEPLATQDNKVASAFKILTKEMQGKFAKSFRSEAPSGSGSTRQTSAGASGSKKMGMSAYKALHPKDQSAYMAGGGTIVDD